MKSPILAEFATVSPRLLVEGGRRARQVASHVAPALTIITVARNARDSLIKSVDSVLALNRDDVAYIVVDGNSKDGTVDFLRHCGDRLEYWISEPDCGIYNAMNKAVRLAAQDSYILFLGAGDTILRLPDAEAITAARIAGTQLLYGDVLIGNWLFRSTFSAKLMYRNTLHHQGLFVRKGCLEEPWFDESLKVFSDWDLNLTLFRRDTSAQRLGFTVAYAEPDGVSAKLHLREIARLVARQCGLFRALVAILYHGSLHYARYYAGILRGIRK
jgi:glycosyltransferase involved in cell wall biosynthesis